MSTGNERPGRLSGTLSSRGSRQQPENQTSQGDLPKPQRSPSLFSERVRAGQRTYFFDVRESSKGNLYLTLSESRPTEGDSFERTRITVFNDHLQDFVQAMGKALDFIEGTGQTSTAQG